MQLSVCPPHERLTPTPNYLYDCLTNDHQPHPKGGIEANRSKDIEKPKRLPEGPLPLQVAPAEAISVSAQLGFWHLEWGLLHCCLMQQEKPQDTTLPTLTRLGPGIRTVAIGSTVYVYKLSDIVGRIEVTL